MGHKNKQSAPVADWVTIDELYRDPFPIYARLRAEGGVHWVPAVNRYLVTSYDAVHETELDQEIFSANESDSLMIRAMGHSMLRRDDPEHYIERKAWQPALRPGVVQNIWRQNFAENATRYLDEFAAKGPGADLVWDFAAPFAAENLRQMCGLYNCTPQDMQRWSQTMIDATGNYADDPEVWRLGKESYDEVDVALDEMLVWHSANPDSSLISQLLLMPDYKMPLERIRANLKMTIGGGLNEPRDAIGVGAYALLQNPDQLALLRANPALWQTAFEETIRWVAPIGMYSRQTTRAINLCGVPLPAGAKLGICVLSANRDSTVWKDADKFDIRREIKPHLAFGKGVHVCLGTWAARASVADIALPQIFQRLAGLRLLENDPAEMGGWVFRGMTKMPVAWDRLRPADAPSAAHQAAELPPLRVAVVGSGPAGCFSAQALHRTFPSANIAIIDQLPTPYGLVRYGVAADHQGTKAVAQQFEQLFSAAQITFHGNCHLGKDVSLAQLRQANDIVVLATGMHQDKPLNIPGAELCRGAGSITRALNGHPDEPAPRPLGEQVIIVGHGNVALDVARLLAKDATQLADSDISDSAHQALAGQVRVIHLIGRAQPAQAKFDPVMVRELANLPGVFHLVHGGGDLSAASRDARIDAVRELLSNSVSRAEAKVRIEWWFGLSPQEVQSATDDAQVSAAVFSYADNREVIIPADAVISAIGFSQNPDSPVVAATHSGGTVEPGLYVAGWLRRGPRGTIPDQRADARALAQQIAADVREQRVRIASRPTQQTTAAAHGISVPTLDFTAWRRIDLRERLSAAPGRIREKLTTRDAMLAAASDLSLEVPPLRPDSSLSAQQAITILFGTESGGAELVADELRRLLTDADVKVADIGEIKPEDLEISRLHLVACSTYGDGEVPTAVKPFYAALREGNPRLQGLQYAMFGMGDSSYAKTYSRGSELLDEALRAAGANRVGEYGRHDAGGDIAATEASREWASGVLATIAAQNRCVLPQ